MGRAVFGFPDYVIYPGGAALRISGGAWRSELPVSNLARPEFAYVARSIDAALTSTQFWVDLGTTRDVRVVSIPRSNASRAARVRVRGFASADVTGTALADTGWQALYPILYPAGSLPWGHPSLWDGRMTEEDRGLSPVPFVRVFGATVLARYWFFEIADTGNTDGFLELPRVVLARGWQPSINISYGAAQSWEDLSQVQTSPTGADYADERPKRRSIRCTLQYVPQNEGLVFIADMQARLGTTRQLLFCMDPDDALNLHRRTFLCRPRTLSPLEFAVFGHVGTAFDLVETIA